MNFFDYIGISEDAFIEDYLDAGYVSQSKHHDFPLDIFTYSRKTVHENKWDAVTSKCRGIIVSRETGEIVARPFEKFHNYGSTLEETTFSGLLPPEEPYVIEKMDGFMCTMYRWNDQNYIASKGSFHSIHAKWATAELRRHLAAKGYNGSELYPGWTAVFEGLHRDLRIVVDYGQRQGLVLLALINNETGEEKSPGALKAINVADFMMPTVYPLGLDEALDSSVKVRQDGIEEGYVLTWYQAKRPPIRLKLKFVEYLRLHRMVCGVSPKRIWEALSQAHLKSDLDEYLTNSTPWFSKFVNKWVTALRTEYDRLCGEGYTRYKCATIVVKDRYSKGELEFSELRKAYAAEFTKEENKEFSPILFALLDGKDVPAVIWKRVKGMTLNGHPMVDAHTT